MGAFSTKEGVAYGLQLVEGLINVGDIVGIYGDVTPMPLAEAEVVAIRYEGKSVGAVGNSRHGGKHPHRSTLFLRVDAMLEPPLKVGPNVRDLAKSFGLSDDELV